jgi:hypothetical protein
MSALGEDEKLEVVLTAYDAACARSRGIAAKFELDHVVRHEELRRVWLRWHYTHDRGDRPGHADILRALADGSTRVLGLSRQRQQWVSRTGRGWSSRCGPCAAASWLRHS